uniref:tumor necrosis factor-like n=1 Tax=Pristiophorus japonicus TaxID=55135 RepID=UPI00398E3BE4
MSASMINESMLLAAEMGGELVKKQTDAKSRSLCWALCAITVLSLVTYASYLFLAQLRVLPSNQVCGLILERRSRKQRWSEKLSRDRMREIYLLKLVSVRPLSVTSPGVSVGACVLHWRLDQTKRPTFPVSELPRVLNVVGKAPKRIALHLTASPKTQEKMKVIWQNMGDLSNGVEFRDNALVIKTPGQYFVYTQLVFYSGHCQGNTIFLSHELTKLSSSDRLKTLLLSSLKSACHYGQHGDPWFKTIYQGAVFELAAGDQIFSQVSRNSVYYVDSKAGSSYFGLFAL